MFKISGSLNNWLSFQDESAEKEASIEIDSDGKNEGDTVHEAHDEAGDGTEDFEDDFSVDDN
jgi:hypothetical protein